MMNYCIRKVLFTFLQKKIVKQHNEAQLDNCKAIDKNPSHNKVTESHVEAIKRRKTSENGNLVYLLKLKIGAQIMLTVNVNIEHRINGLVDLNFVIQIFFSLLTYEDYNGISILTISKPQLYEYSITVVYLSIPEYSSYRFLRSTDLSPVTNSRKIDVLLGDFNIDASDGDFCARFYDILSNYRLVVKEPTHLYGALLHHTYFHKLLPNGDVNAVAKNMYFSDQDALKLQIFVGRNDNIHFDRTM